MTTWKHCRVFVYTGGDAEPEVYVHHYDNDSGPVRVGNTGFNTTRRDDGVQNTIKALGAQGWEMVTVLYTPDDAERLTYYFKRQG